MIQVIILIAIVAIVIKLVMLLPKSDCTGNCNQGRECTCKNNK